MSGAWGSGEFGAGSWGGGEGTLTLLGAFALRENVIRLAFSQPVYFSSILDPLDASNPEKYSVTAVSGTFGIDGSPARPVNAVRVTLPTEADGLIPAAVSRVVDAPRTQKTLGIHDRSARVDCSTQGLGVGDVA